MSPAQFIMDVPQDTSFFVKFYSQQIWTDWGSKSESDAVIQVITDSLLLL